MLIFHPSSLVVDWPPALASPQESAINRDFYLQVVTVIVYLIAVVSGWQLLELIVSKSYGHYKIKYNFGSISGLTHKIRILSSLLFTCILLYIATESHKKSITQFIAAVASVNVFLVLPIQVLEPSRSSIPLASPLLFWFAAIFWSLVALIQDSLLQKHKLLCAGHAASNWPDFALFIVAVISFLLEVGFWEPTKELKEYFDLNEWRLDLERNLFSVLTFSWIQKIISKVYKTDDIAYEDLLPPPEFLMAESSSSALQGTWDKLVANAKAKVKKSKNPSKKINPSLFIAIIKAFWPIIGVSFLLGFITTCSEFIQPVLLNKFIKFFAARGSDAPDEDNKPPFIVGYFLACLMFATAVFRFLLFNQYFALFFNLGFIIDLSLKTLVYNKALRLSPESKKSKTTGDIINNFTVDIRTVESFTMQLQDFVLTPVKFILCIFSLYKFLGNATWVGLLTAVVFIPLSSLVSMSFMKLYPILMKHSDERTSLTTEILTTIKSIKLYSWEKPMLQRLSDIRNGKELATLRKIGIYSAGAIFLWECLPFFILVASFTGFVYIYDIPLTPEIIFPVLLLFDMLTEPVNMLPSLISQLIESRTSLTRLSNLLLLEEVDSIVQSTNKKIEVGDVSVQVSSATFVWTNTKKEPTEGTDEEATIESTKDEIALTDINLTARKGKLTCVVGRVGSGKTTLFKALLGEIPLAEDSSGSITINGSVAYCSQLPWILNATVKENILFGCKYNKAFYDLTVEACELISDFDTLADGDATLVGEKGISLSGGQKARISLARAVYSRADVFLLDDVLSAVDAHVGKNLIEKVLGPEGIISSKTRILCTNSVPVLHEASEILLLKKGRFVERGAFDEVMNRNQDLAKLIKEFGKQGEKSSSAEQTPVETPAETPDITRATSPVKLVAEVAAGIGLEAGTTKINTDEQDANLERLERVLSRNSVGRASLTSFSHVYQEEDISQSKNANEEKTEKGRVKLSVFIEYFKACNFWWTGIYVILTLLIYQLTLFERAILTQWSNENAKAGKTINAKFYLLIYFGIGILAGLINLISSYIIWTLVIIRGAKYFHDTMIQSVIRSPMRFFETTPVGRILNRFTDDISTIDQRLPWIFIMFLSFVSNGIVTFGAIIFTLPAMSLIIAALLYVYNFIRKFFIPALRELKRLSSKNKSPQVSHVQELINGVDTVKAYSQEERFIYKNRANINKVITIEYNSQSVNRWLSIRLQFISALLIFTSGLLSLSTIGTKSELSPSVLGFVMIYALLITGILNAIVRMWSEIETQTVAVERLIEYCKLVPEADEVIEDNRPPTEWPSKGELSLNNYSTRYAENLNPVLKNITLSIKGKEKIGIVGRTGAGKSSLTLALFRIIEPLTGNITIDDINTSNIGLSDLRHHLSIIPQDAHTVEGSVRQNLDPFSEYTDEQLWKALELANLKEHVELMKTEPTQKDKDNADKKDGEVLETKYGLDAKIYEGGSNLLAGQKQLLCLSRALLNPLKILLLDEATAAVDVETDKIIQQTIRSEFKDKTILIIAHRLETIMDSDRIIVLDFGEVKEFDTPENLLKNKDGIFYLLCEKGGYLPSNN